MRLSETPEFPRLVGVCPVWKSKPGPQPLGHWVGWQTSGRRARVWRSLPSHSVNRLPATDLRELTSVWKLGTLAEDLLPYFSSL